MNSIIYEPHRRNQARRDLNKTSLKWDAVCAKLKQLKSPSPTKTFWRKNLRIVRVDPSEILDRVFCRCGLVDVYQDAINLTAMDKRSFAPPIETNWERVVNMANTCETFRINPTTTSRLIKCGFTSITLLSMAEGNFEERGLTGDRLKNCLSVLNDRRVHILEPSYSLQRLVNARRKRWSEMKKYQFLDLASVNGKKLGELRPPDREYRLPEPMIAKSTFKNFDTQLIFGPRSRRECDCVKKHGRELLTSVSSSSGYSSGASSVDLVPDSPDSLRSFSQVCRIEPGSPLPPQNITPLPNPQTRRLHRPQDRPFTPRTISFGKCQDPMSGMKMHCPRPDCKWMYFPNQIEDHCARRHGIKTGGVRAYAYQEVYQPHGRESFKQLVGDVKFRINAKDIISNDESKSKLWWGPFPFVFDNVTFYQLVYKKTDIDAPWNESRILFWIWAALPQPELNNYRYEIHFDIPPNMKPLRQHYSGTVKSLEISASELTQHNTHHYRSIVYFTQTHIRRALSFTHNLQQPPPKTLDMKYTVKIMRQS